MKKVYAGEHFHKYELYNKRFFLTVLEDSQKKKNMQSSEDTKFFRLIYNIFQSLQFTSVK